MTAVPFVGTGAWSPSLSPGGDRIAYVSDRDGVPGVWVQPVVDARYPSRITVIRDPVLEVSWSIDGDWLALLVAPGGSPRTQVWVVRPDGTRLRRLAPDAPGATHLGPWTHTPGRIAIARTTLPPAGVAILEDVATGDQRVFARDGQPLVLDIDRRGRMALVRRGPEGARTVWLVDLETAQNLQLMPSGQAGSADLGRLSPDGQVAYVRSDEFRDAHVLFAIDLRTDGTTRTAGPARVLAERADGELEQLVLTSDGVAAMLLWNCEGRSSCERYDLRTGDREPIVLPEPIAHGGSFSLDGRRLAMTLEGPTHPRSVWLFDVGSGVWRRLTDQETGWTPPSVAPTLERLRADDGLEITGWLYRATTPEGDPVGGPGPAVVHLHGGLDGCARPAYDPLFQALVARGVTVFAPNVRGSAGFGRAFAEAGDLDRRWAAIADVAACARHLVARGVAAPRRIACAGRSYGAYLTLAALVAYPDLFAAGLDVAGMADFHTFFANTEPWIALPAYSKYGHPVKDAELLRGLSPIHRFDRLRAPLFVVHGRLDTRVPLEESERVVASARAHGLPVEFLLFEEEGHQLLHTRSRQRFVTAAADWLVAHL